MDDRTVAEPVIGVGTRFDPRTPPPMFITRDRLMRGLIFGAMTTLIGGLILGAAFAAVSIVIPGLAMLVLAFLGGAACRSGFGGRAASQSKARVVFASVLIAVLALLGLVTGSWGLERFIGTRAEMTKEELYDGERDLREQREAAEDEGMKVVIEHRLDEVHRLLQLSNPQIEDYLWSQEAQINQPLLAFAKLRATRGPVVRLGADSDPFSLPMAPTLAILVAELILGLIVVSRALTSR
jgi:hypothetical protein